MSFMILTHRQQTGSQQLLFWLEWLRIATVGENLAVGRKEVTVVPYVVRAGDDQTDQKATTDVEDQDTIKGSPNRLGNVDTRVFGLAHSHSDQLGTNKREQRVGQRAPEAKEYGQVVIMDLVLQIVAEGAGGPSPISEADAIMLRITAQVEDDTHENKTNWCEYFDTAEPEF
jgi:hypothetical protein